MAAISPLQIITPYLNVEPYLHYSHPNSRRELHSYDVCAGYLEARIQYRIPFKKPQHIERSSVYLPAQKQFDELNNHAAS